MNINKKKNNQGKMYLTKMKTEKISVTTTTTKTRMVKKQHRQQQQKQ